MEQLEQIFIEPVTPKEIKFLDNKGNVVGEFLQDKGFTGLNETPIYESIWFEHGNSASQDQIARLKQKAIQEKFKEAYQRKHGKLRYKDTCFYAIEEERVQPLCPATNPKQIMGLTVQFYKKETVNRNQ